MPNNENENPDIILVFEELLSDSPICCVAGLLFVTDVRDLSYYCYTLGDTWRDAGGCYMLWLLRQPVTHILTMVSMIMMWVIVEPLSAFLSALGFMLVY